MHKLFLLAALGCAVVVAAEASAQTAGTSCGAMTSLTDRCRQQFERWHKAELKWREWVQRNGNGYAHSASGHVMKSRPRRPAPLAWMSAYCSRVPSTQPECVAHVEALEYDWVAHQPPPRPLYVNRKAVRAGEGFDIWTWLWRSTHIDVGWTAPDPRQQTVGLVGVHLSLAQIGDRLYVFGPGALVTMHNGQLTVGTTWGVSYRLTDFRFFGAGPSFDLFLNAANLRIDRGPVESASVGPARGVIGLSFAIRK